MAGWQWKGHRLVYFIHSPETNRVKIGLTTVHPDLRLLVLRQMNAAELVPLAVMQGGKDLERELHERFQAHRHHYEWFAYHQEIENYVKTHGYAWPDPEPKPKLEQTKPDDYDRPMTSAEEKGWNHLMQSLFGEPRPAPKLAAELAPDESCR